MVDEITLLQQDTSSLQKQRETWRTYLRVVSALNHTVHDALVETAICLPQGLADSVPNLLIYEPGQPPIVAGTEIRSRWSDGSIQWCGVFVVVPRLAPGETAWSVAIPTGPIDEFIPVVPSVAPPALEDGHLLVARDQTFAHRLRIEFVLDEIRQVAVSLQPAGSRVHFPVLRVDRFMGSLPEAPGVEICVRLTTALESGVCRYTIRVRNSRRARHKSGRWNLGDRGSFVFQGLIAQVEPLAILPQQVQWMTHPGHPGRRTTTPELSLYQASSGTENWQSHNHVNADGTLPTAIRGYCLHADRTVEVGDHASPTVTLTGDLTQPRTTGGRGALSVAYPEFWETFPSSLHVQNERISVGLFPSGGVTFHELQGGEQKTLSFVVSPAFNPQELAWVHDPPAAVQPSQTLDSTDFFGDAGLSPEVDWRPLDSFLNRALASPATFEDRRRTIDEFGWRHYGDFGTQLSKPMASRQQVRISHSNNRNDILYGLVLQYLRTGRQHWCRTFDPLARHVADIDIYHTTEDRADLNGGMFKPTPQDKSAGTATHRGFLEDASDPYGSSQAGPCAEHNHTSGLLLHYYLTGNEESREAILSLADWVVHSDDGMNTVWGLLDPGPTGVATASRSAEMQFSALASGNSVNALLDAWSLTNRRAYWECAEQLLLRAYMTLGSAEARPSLPSWHQAVLLMSTGRYLKLRSSDHARDAVFETVLGGLRAASHSLVNGMDELQDHICRNPFEPLLATVQSLHICNALHQAAAFAPTATARDQLVRASNSLSESVWAVLGQSEDVDDVGVLSVVLTEGTRNLSTRRTLPSLYVPGPVRHVVQSGPGFVPQQDRIRMRIRNLAGIVSLMGNATRISRWPKLLDRLKRDLGFPGRVQ